MSVDGTDQVSPLQMSGKKDPLWTAENEAWALAEQAMTSRGHLEPRGKVGYMF